MNKKRPLLSICIPTYNGASRIKSVLDFLFNGIVLCDNLIELIIADNHSSDNTEQVIKSYIDSIDNINLKYVRYKSNVGYNYSVINIIKNLAQGEYIWLLGDDDYVMPESLPYICSILASKKFDYLHLNHIVVKDKNELKKMINTRDFHYHEGKMQNTIDDNAKYSDLMATFMSSSIGKLDIIKEMDFSIFQKETWSDYKSVFPISYIMVTCFSNLRCAEITTPLIICIAHKKAWDNKLELMNLKFLPSLLFDYEKNGLKLPNNRFLIAKGMLLSIINKPTNIKYINIKHFSLFFSKSIFKHILKRIKSKI